MSRRSEKLKLGAQACNHVSNTEKFECYINPKVMIKLYTTQFANGNPLAAEWHIINFERICKTIQVPNLDPMILKDKLFPQSLTQIAKIWYDNTPKRYLKSWYNVRASFLDRFGKCTLYHKKIILDFKQQENETLTETWLRFKKLAFNMEHGLKD